MQRVHPLGGGKARFEGFAVLWALGLRACWVLGFRVWVSCFFGASRVYCMFT
jgi:hypothetical protein